MPGALASAPDVPNKLALESPPKVGDQRGVSLRSNPAPILVAAALMLCIGVIEILRVLLAEIWSSVALRIADIHCSFTLGVSTYT
jgi:hypothetical protein